MKNPVMRFTAQKKEVEYTLWRIDDDIRLKLYKNSPVFSQIMLPIVASSSF